MKILIVGGNRFFGKRLAAQHLERGAKVTLLNRGALADGFGGRVERIVMDRKDLSRETLRGKAWDVVYDQVCYDAAEAHAACEAFTGKVGRYVFTSSQSVYHPGAALSESAFEPRLHEFESWVERTEDYGEAKRQAESTFFREAPFPVTAVRFPIVLGPDDYTERLKFHVQRIRDGKPIRLTSLEPRISFVHAADAAGFLFRLSEAPLEGPINCCAEKPIQLRRVLELIELATGKKAQLVREGGDESPFGVEGDWYMDVARLKSYGFRPREIEAFLPELISPVGA